MASIRILKKDINYLASELVGQAFFNEYYIKSISNVPLAEICAEAVEFRNSFLARVNHPDGKDNPKLTKKYYSNLRNDLVKQFGDIAEKINQKK